MVLAFLLPFLLTYVKFYQNSQECRFSVLFAYYSSFRVLLWIFDIIFYSIDK